jgi:hypothetical protein
MRRIIVATITMAAGLMSGCVLPPPGTTRPEAPESAAAKPPPAPQAAVSPQRGSPPPSAEQIHQAFTALNAKLKTEYERALDEKGSRSLKANRTTAFDALHAGLTRLGMIVESRDPDAGILTVAAPAPRPLSAEEWRRTVQSDLPMMAEILCPILGAYCTAIKFEPDDYVIVINATVLPAAGGSEITLTTRMREIAPRAGVPRREYPPPTGVRTALDKIWAAYDQALAERGAR